MRISHPCQGSSVSEESGGNGDQGGPTPEESERIKKRVMEEFGKKEDNGSE